MRQLTPACPDVAEACGPCIAAYRWAMRTLAQRERRLEIARLASRIEIGLGTIAVVLPPLFLVAGPTPFTGMFWHQPAWRPPIELVAYGLAVLGYIWLLRIRFTGPEDGARSNWRSH